MKTRLALSKWGMSVRCVVYVGVESETVQEAA